MAAPTKIARTVAIVLRAVSLLTTNSSASAETFEQRQACIGDAFQFCTSAMPDRNRVFGCLIDNKDVISAACHSVIAPYVPVDQTSSQNQPPRNASANKWPLNISSH